MNPKDIQTYQNKSMYYRDQINILVNQYKNFLNDDTSISDTMLLRHNTFNALLNFIGINLFNDNPLYNIYIKNPDNIDLSNTDLLSVLLDIYINLSGKYNHRFTVNGFCLMLNINKQDIMTLAASADGCRLIRKLKGLCEQSLLSGSQTFDLFLLKSQFGYSENPQAVPQEEEVQADIPDIYGSFPELLPDSRQEQPK